MVRRARASLAATSGAHRVVLRVGEPLIEPASRPIVRAPDAPLTADETSRIVRTSAGENETRLELDSVAARRIALLQPREL